MKSLFVVALLALALEASSAQTYTVLHTFTNGPDGETPGGILVTNSGAIFGTAQSRLFKINPDGTGFAVVSSLSGSFGPPSSIISSGNLFYGATLGDVPQAANYAFAFKIMTNGLGFANTTNLGLGLSANSPSLSLLSGTNLFGTSDDGGTSHNGTVFALNTNNTKLTILKSFSALVSKTNSDGAEPAITLVQSGNALFGTTYAGGSSGQGVVFCVTNDGSGFTVLKSFSALVSNTNGDGAEPLSGLVLSGSTLFGTTSAGGSSNGVVFKLNTDGTGFNVLKTFSGTTSGTNSDGAYPTEIILNGSTLYGTTQQGGTAGKGVVFSVNTNGTGFTVLKNFGTAGGSSPSDGATPTGNLLLIRSTLYGATQGGGTNSQGVLFSLTVPPTILTTDGNFGVQTNIFGFDYTGVYGQSMVVEAATNLLHPGWTPLATNTLGTGPVHFQDSKWMLFPNRFYRVRGQ